MYYLDEQHLSRSEKTEKREREILEIIIAYQMKHQIAPTVREIKTYSKFTSTSTISVYLKRLRKKGVIDFREKSPRSIKILKRK